ncbi:tail fiber protein [Pedobacter cryoconitis]|uniref:tail fiber protein n=1 Tax=Pedobacter cryoconitis TaxID=188932 RepID=UPI0016130D0B|nr:tail fiber protein [Pedobacter cryoconitis]MBB5649150.1 hypothetical protein [Pedobacter cryoconitis]
MKKVLMILTAMVLFLSAKSQSNTDQNGIKTTVTNVLSAQNAQAKRFEIITLGYNSHHWQKGGAIIIELFDAYYATGYEKYIVEAGYLQGTPGTSPKLRFVNRYGYSHNGRIVLGTPTDMGISYGGYPNMTMAIYLDIKEYSQYRVRITYMQDRINTFTDHNQVRVQEDPAGVNIEDFMAPDMPDENLITAGQLTVSGSGNHYFQNGNVGIGTTQPDAKLSVKGKIHAEEIKVDLNIPGPDYVFDKDYSLLSLQETADFIKANRHLPDVPSAKQMEKEGINVSEMQMKLLQKIEELTLYVIRQQKMIDKQAVDLKKMQEQINSGKSNN